MALFLHNNPLYELHWIFFCHHVANNCLPKKKKKTKCNTAIQFQLLFRPTARVGSFYVRKSCIETELGSVMLMETKINSLKPMDLPKTVEFVFCTKLVCFIL
jgi:hypothetical protein